MPGFSLGPAGSRGRIRDLQGMQICVFLFIFTPYVFSVHRCLSNIASYLWGLLNANVCASRSLPFPCFLLFVFQDKPLCLVKPFI